MAGFGTKLWLNLCPSGHLESLVVCVLFPSPRRKELQYNFKSFFWLFEIECGGQVLLRVKSCIHQERAVKGKHEFLVYWVCCQAFALFKPVTISASKICVLETKYKTISPE
jgi:hypothetical protein